MKLRVKQLNNNLKSKDKRVKINPSVTHNILCEIDTMI